MACMLFPCALARSSAFLVRGVLRLWVRAFDSAAHLASWRSLAGRGSTLQPASGGRTDSPGSTILLCQYSSRYADTRRHSHAYTHTRACTHTRAHLCSAAMQIDERVGTAEDTRMPTGSIPGDASTSRTPAAASRCPYAVCRMSAPHFAQP
eukprot:3373927-Rhodomonas_salina.1